MSVARAGLPQNGLDCVALRCVWGQRSGTKILCMHNLSRIYDWQYCHAVPQEEQEEEAEEAQEDVEEDARRGAAGAWRLARRLCVQEIKLPNAHYLSKGSARFKVMKMAKLC